MNAATRRAAPAPLATLSPVPPLGTRFERVETRKGKVVARRQYKLISSKPSEPDMAGEHKLVCIPR
jgi:hypothetical protein